MNLYIFSVHGSYIGGAMGIVAANETALLHFINEKQFLERTNDRYSFPDGFFFLDINQSKKVKELHKKANSSYQYAEAVTQYAKECGANENFNDSAWWTLDFVIPTDQFLPGVLFLEMHYG